MSVIALRRVLRATLVGAFALVSSALFIAPAAADTTYLRLAHFSPDTPEVDVYVASVADPGTSMVVLRGVAYGVVSEYQILPGGQYTVSMRPAGAAESTPPVIATTLEATTGSAYTVAGVGTFAELGLTVLNDDLSLPPDGMARARVIQAAASQPTLDISVAGGMSLGSGVEFATTTPYTNIDPGEWVLEVSGDSETLAETPITVAAGAVYSVLILDTPSGITAAVQLDSTATGVVPVGGIASGAGGLASARLGSDSVITAVLLTLSGLGLLTLAGYVAFGRNARPKASVG